MNCSMEKMFNDAKKYLLEVGDPSRPREVLVLLGYSAAMLDSTGTFRIWKSSVPLTVRDVLTSKPVYVRQWCLDDNSQWEYFCHCEGKNSAGYFREILELADHVRLNFRHLLRHGNFERYE